MAITNAAQIQKKVSDPLAAYDSLKPLWNRNRALCSGERFVKSYDSYLDIYEFSNLLIPFSPSMSEEQYRFYKSEAELPGISSQFSKTIVGGLLRKQPVLELPKDAPEDAYNWIMHEFGQDDSSVASFLDNALWEEIQTSRCWVYVDYPSVPEIESMTRQEMLEIKPYPVIWQAETVINWRTTSTTHGKVILNRVITRGYVERFEENEFHPSFIDTVRVHELDESGFYQIRVFERKDPTTSVPIINGQKQYQPSRHQAHFELIETITNIQANGERLRIIPAWPLNGSIEPTEPLLTPIIDKEISLYNKISRRNHLLYGASTYTPMIFSDMPDDEFESIVDSGLGTWLKLRQGDNAKILETPTAALADMEKAIASGIEEMAKLGIRMLSPETAQSGIALELRNATQNAQLGTLNSKISNTMRQIIAFMINWRYNLDYKPSDIQFELSADFNPTPLGADWLRLSTEWYKEGLIPRSIWLQILKQNDMLAPDYNDEEGKLEINQDELLIPKGSDDFANKLTEGDMSFGDGRSYPNGEPIDKKLPKAYKLATGDEKCENCKFYDTEQFTCKAWDNAAVRPMYWCAKWEAK
jgi:hypothetical protein